MVSVEKIKMSLGDLIRRADRYVNKKLETNTAGNISKSLNLLADLLGEEGFLPEAGEIRMISANVSRNSKLTQDHIGKLKTIFHKLEEE